MAGDIVQTSVEGFAMARVAGRLLPPVERGPEFAQMHRVLARFQQELANLRKAEQRLRAQQVITRALAECSSVAEASPRIFEALCATLDCDWAELWRIDSTANVLRCTQTWQPKSSRAAGLNRAVRVATFTCGEGIPGSAWARNKPVWVTDLAQQPTLRRVAGIDKFGLRTAFAFPIRLNREVLGVIALFSRQVQPPDKHLLRLLRDICSQIGQVMGRRRAERRLLDISEREQQRIGQDLHDGLCQQLAGIAYMASNLESRLTRRSLPETTVAARISELSRETAAQARQIARGLNPVKLGVGGLTAALDALAGSIQSMFSIHCQFECQRPIPIHDHETAMHLYRIAQEAIHNAITHGKATEIVIALTRERSSLTLRITDNGRGLIRGKHNGAGMGIENMNYRARAISAKLQFIPRPGGGTVTDCQFNQHNGRVK